MEAVAARHCRTRRRNAHRTGEAEEREVLYRWHPWSGRVVRVHEVVAKEAGAVLRCSLEDAMRGGGWSFRPGCSIGFHASDADRGTPMRRRRRAFGADGRSRGGVSPAALVARSGFGRRMGLLQPESGRHPCHASAIGAFTKVFSSISSVCRM